MHPKRRGGGGSKCLRIPECISISVAPSSFPVCFHPHALLVASRPRFGCDSQARTPQLVWTSWRETQLGRNQLDRLSWTGTSYSHETGTRPTGFSYVYKYLLVPQVE